MDINTLAYKIVRMSIGEEPKKNKYSPGQPREAMRGPPRLRLKAKCYWSKGGKSPLGWFEITDPSEITIPLQIFNNANWRRLGGAPLSGRV
jgi:hypothetical protein